MDYIAQPKDYWIAQEAIKITLNALGNPNRIQGSLASGAAILCYIEGVDGLGYDNGHRFKTWPLSLSPTFFNTNTRKYVYAAIPRTSSIGTQAVVVFPSEQLDIYGKNASDTQVGSSDYYYIWLQGIINATDGTSSRTWAQQVDFGRKGTDEDLYDDTESDWYQYSKVSETVTFLKKITMKAGSWFQNIFLGDSAHELVGVATGATEFVDADKLVATPSYISRHFLRKDADDEATGLIGMLQGIGFGQKDAQTGEYSFGIDHAGMAHLLDIIFNRVLKGNGARKGFTDGTGIYMDALEGLIEADGMNIRGFLRVMELIINRLQLMESDYSFTEGDTTERVDFADTGQTMVLTMHKEHDNDHTPFYPGDILYAKINDLLDHGTYYTCWVRTISVDLSNNTIKVVPYNGRLANNTPIVPGATNFTFLGTEITTDYTTAMLADYAAHPDGYEKIITLTRHGNIADGIDPATGQYDEHIHQSQLGRQQAWVLSTTDQRLSFLWNVDTPIVKDEYYALCLGILPDLANLPSTRNPNMPSLYINTLFADNIEQANYPAKVVKEDRGQWTANPTAIYDGDMGGTWTPDGTTQVDGDPATYSQHTKYGQQGVPQIVRVGDTINEPYHYRTFTKVDWLSRRLSSSWASRTDAQIEKMMLKSAPKADLEVSRVWKGGKLWECLVDGTTQEPALGCTDWQCISGDMNFYIEFQSTNGNSFYQGHVSTVVTARLWWGTEDVTSLVGALSFSWTRSSESGKTDADRAWDAQQGHSGTNVLSLTDSDMPTAWSRNNKAIFTCTVRYNNEVVAENEVIA